jgi:hypothetical protein
MVAFLGAETPEDQTSALKKALLDDTDDVMAISDKKKQLDMMLVIVLISESLINKSTEDEPGFKFFTQNFG